MTKLEEHVAEYISYGCQVAGGLGFVKMPSGYELMLNPDESHFFWLCEDGRNSVIHWDRWAAYRGAKEDARMRASMSADEIVEREICLLNEEAYLKRHKGAF